MATETLNIFISYGRKDARHFALRLRDSLQAYGYSVWLDLAEIQGGANWAETIEAAIESCDVTLALMSHASYESQWCRAEQLRALRKSKRLIPLRLQVDAETPLHLEHVNHLDFTDESLYDQNLRDLVSDITAGQAFRAPATSTHSRSPYKAPRPMRALPEEKRNAVAFRRHIRALRQEAWLGARAWWPYFLFAFVDLPTVAQALTSGEFTAPFERGGGLNSRWDKFVRLHFRPRPPSVFHAEGFRPAGHTPAHYASIPVYMLFDLEAVIAHPEARFSDGDLARTNKTFKTPTSFSELPFELIYHDSWFMPDERDEVMRCREAQVLIPDRLSLEALQLVWMRSPAEYETLHHLLPMDVWRRWRDRITARTDYHLFNHKWPYIRLANLNETSIRLSFNSAAEREGTFALKIEVTGQGGHSQWQDEAYVPDGDLIVSLPPDIGAYTARVTLDGELAYSGACASDSQLA